MNSPSPRRRTLRRTSVVVVVIALAFGLIWFIAALALFVFPRQEPLREADAVVSLSPPSERLPVALRAIEDGVAPRIWISYVPADITNAGDERRIDQLCREHLESGIVCFPPDTNDTIGEARATAELVRETAVTSVIVVTDTSHSARARYLFERCLPEGTNVQLLLVDEPDSPLYRFERMLYETGAFMKAIVEATACPS